MWRRCFAAVKNRLRRMLLPHAFEVASEACGEKRAYRRCAFVWYHWCRMETWVLPGCAFELFSRSGHSEGVRPVYAGALGWFYIASAVSMWFRRVSVVDGEAFHLTSWF